MPVEVGVYDEIEGMSVRTDSPLALFHLRAAFILSGVFGPPRDRDIAIQAMLRDRLLSGRTKEELRAPHSSRLR